MGCVRARGVAAQWQRRGVQLRVFAQRMVATHEKPGEAAHFCSRFSSTKWCGKKIGLSLSLHCDESTGVGGVRLRGEGVVGARARAS